MDCSVTEVFIKEWNRMCNNYGMCVGCTFDGNCNSLIKQNPEKYVKIIQKWSDEHPDEHPIEIDWNKVPVDTPVLVRDFCDCQWKKRYFALCIGCGSERKLYAFNDEKKKNEADHLTVWRYCKLAPEVDPTPYLKERFY